MDAEAGGERWIGGGEAELDASWLFPSFFLLFPCFLFGHVCCAADAAAGESTRLGLRQVAEGGREAVGRCQPGRPMQATGGSSVSELLPF